MTGREGVPTLTAAQRKQAQRGIFRQLGAMVALSDGLVPNNRAGRRAAERAAQKARRKRAAR